MIRILNPILLVAAWPAFAADVMEQVLDHRAVIVCPVATDRLTTVRFPSAIAGVNGAYVGVTTDPPARFQIQFETGTPLFSIRALSNNVTGTINVFWRDQTYILRLESSERPVLSLICTAPVPAAPPTVASNAPPTPVAAPPNPAVEALIRLKNPRLTESATLVRRRLSAAVTCPGGILRTDEAIALTDSGLLAVRCTFFNETGRPFRPCGEMLRLEIGDAVTVPLHVEVPDHVLVGKSEPVYVVVGCEGLDPAVLIQRRLRVHSDIAGAKNPGNFKP